MRRRSERDDRGERGVGAGVRHRPHLRRREPCRRAWRPSLKRDVHRMALARAQEVLLARVDELDRSSRLPRSDRRARADLARHVLLAAEAAAGHRLHDADRREREPEDASRPPSERRTGTASSRRPSSSRRPPAPRGRRGARDSVLLVVRAERPLDDDVRVVEARFDVSLPDPVVEEDVPAEAALALPHSCTSGASGFIASTASKTPGSSLKSTFTAPAASRAATASRPRR